MFTRGYTEAPNLVSPSPIRVPSGYMVPIPRSTEDSQKENEIIDRFNAYVRGPLHDSLMGSMGRETETWNEGVK